MNESMGGGMGGWWNERMDGWVDGWMDERMDGLFSAVMTCSNEICEFFTDSNFLDSVSSYFVKFLRIA